jgi:hypothetical protein
MKAMAFRGALRKADLRPVTTSWECPAEQHGTWSSRHQTDFSTWQELPNIYQRPSGAPLAAFRKGRAASTSSGTSPLARHNVNSGLIKSLKTAALSQKNLKLPK